LAEHLNDWHHVKAAIATAPPDASIAVYARDLNGGQWFGHNEDEVFPSASTIKIVLLAALAQAVESSRLSLNDLVPIQESQRVGGSGILQGMSTPDLRLTLADHALLMITISDNTASNVLIDAIGEAEIGNTIQRLGLVATELNRRFIGRTPDSGSPDNLTTAHDLVRVLIAIASQTVGGGELSNWAMSILAAQQFTDRLGRALPPDVTFAGKSGWLDGLSHDCGLLRSEKGTAAVAVLTRGIADKQEASNLIGRIGTAVVNDLNLS
jgi:beta-lactamase class A